MGGEFGIEGIRAEKGRKTCLFSDQLEKNAEQGQNERQVGRKGACLTRKEAQEMSERSGPHLLEECGNLTHPKTRKMGRNSCKMRSSSTCSD